MPRLENGLMVLAKGYAWLPDKRRSAGQGAVHSLGRSAFWAATSASSS
jgi:hypothetical protein